MNTTSPSKRRALAPVDANTRSPLGTSRLSPSKLGLSKPKMFSVVSPIKSSPIKRPMEQGGDPETPGSAKKRRISETRPEPLSSRNEKPLQKDVNNTPRPRSTSPEDLSLFDNSTIENSQVTVISEPDVETTVTPAVAPAVPGNRPRHGSMTREEARKKAEIIRLRLGLAGYKVKTNQTDVPLDKLQVRPLPGRGLKRTPSTILSPATSTQCKTAITGKDEKQRLSSPARIERDSRRTALPQAPSPSRRGSDSTISCTDADKSPPRTQETEQTLPPTVLNTPQQSQTGKNDVRLADNELGGAAEGLLSLSQSSPASAL
ncbi:hypothetical protein F5Y01DRAFT_278061, partial [Xylaria sp. FL0043]